MEEAAEQLAEKLEDLPETDADARLMMPPTPILRDENWPLLTVSKGFFENLAAKAVGGTYRLEVLRQSNTSHSAAPVTGSMHNPACSTQVLPILSIIFLPGGCQKPTD